MLCLHRNAPLNLPLVMSARLAAIEGAERKIKGSRSARAGHSLMYAACLDWTQLALFITLGSSGASLLEIHFVLVQCTVSLFEGHFSKD
jgi:hypothetical protein